MRKLVGFMALFILMSGVTPASATGVVHIHPKNAAVKTYNDVQIAIEPSSLMLTTSDGVGVLYVGRAACTAVGELYKCVPYDATYAAGSTTTHIVLIDGTAWLNPTDKAQLIPGSGRKLAPHGVALTMRTKAGTDVTLSGTADSIYR